METYSVSKIKTYDMCKLKYKLTYIDKKRPEERVSDDVVFGRLVHKAFEIYNPELDNKKDIVKLIREYPKLSDQYKKYLTPAFKSLFEFYRKYGKYPADEELRIDYDLGDFRITGYVDRFMYTPKLYICTDYKTSKRANLDYHIFQLKFYNLALSKMYDINPKDIKMMLFFPRPNEEKKTIFSGYDIQNFEKELRKKIIEIESNTEWPATPGYHCNWCPFYNTSDCPDTLQTNSVIE